MGTLVDDGEDDKVVDDVVDAAAEVAVDMPCNEVEEPHNLETDDNNLEDILGNTVAGMELFQVAQDGVIHL